MALDYINDYQCKVKDTMPLGELVPLVKRRDHCRYVLQDMMQNGTPEKQALETEIELQVRTPDGTESTSAKLADMLESTKALEELEVNCKCCPVSQDQNFGCYCVINYPISAKAEKWLAEIAQQIVRNGSVKESILHFILDAKVDGGVITRMRAAGDGYLELRKPVEIVVEKSFFKKKSVNTDQILNVLLAEELLEYPMGALKFSGGLSEFDAKPACKPNVMTAKVMAEDGQISWQVYDLPDDETDDHSISDLKKFFRAVFLAYANNSVILIDR